MDDYHYIRNSQVHQFLAHIIRYLPEGVLLAIASRTDPPLVLDRLRAGRQMVEVRGRDLRFSDEEINAYLESTLGPDTDGQTASLLAERAEGWVVGLHLATLVWPTQVSVTLLPSTCRVCTYSTINARLHLGFNGSRRDPIQWLRRSTGRAC